MAASVLCSSGRVLRHLRCRMWNIKNVHARNTSCNAEVEKPDIRKLADLAHINVSDEEVRDWEPKLNSITDWFAQLQAVDLSDVPPSLRAPSESSNRLREDVPETHVLSETFLDRVPDREGQFIKVPKITSGAD